MVATEESAADRFWEMTRPSLNWTFWHIWAGVMGHHGHLLWFLVSEQMERNWRERRPRGYAAEPVSTEMASAAEILRRDALGDFNEWYLRESEKQRAQMLLVEEYLMVSGCDCVAAVLAVADGCSLAVPRHIDVIGAHLEQAEALVGVFNLVVNETSEKTPSTFLNVGDAFPRAFAAVSAFLR